MPQPVVGAVHIDAALTNIATAYMQSNDVYIADKIFPTVPVEHKSNKYFVYTKGDWFRDEAQMRADGTESAGSGYNLTSNSYIAEEYALHQDIGEQMRSNADPAVDPDVAATKILMQKLAIKRDRQFVTTFMTTSVWNTDMTGAATADSTHVVYWDDDANGDPFTDIATAQTKILQNTGFLPNVLVLGFPVYQALRKHPLVIDRIKYTSPAYAGKITPQLLAEAFDVERVVISQAVYNSANEGATDVFSFITGKNALLVYTPSAPGLMVPAAGYIFAWSGFSGVGNSGIRVSQIAMPWRGLGTVRTEASMAYDMQKVAGDLGYFFSAVTQ